MPIIGSNSIFIHFIVLPGLKENEKMEITKLTIYANSNSPTLYSLKTKKGYVTNEAFRLILNQFSKKLKKDGINDRVLLLMDQLCQHTSNEAIEYCAMNKIMPVFIAKHSTHFYQPLDNLCFASLKKHFKQNWVKILPTVILLKSSINKISI